MSTCRGWAVLVGVALAIAAPSSAREWTRIVDATDALPGGSTLFPAYDIDLAVRRDGSVSFGADFISSSEIFLWSPAAGIARLVRFVEEPNFEGVPGLTLQGRYDSFVDAGDRVGVGRSGLGACDPFTFAPAVVSVDDAGSVATVVRAGMPAPGFAPGWFLQGGFGANGTSDPLIAANREGRLAMIARSQQAELCQDDVLTPLADSLFVSESDGTLVRVATDGDPPPGRPVADTFVLQNRYRLNEAGDLAFAALIDPDAPGPTLTSIYRWHAESGASLVWHEGLFESAYLDTLGSTVDFALGPSGHVAFAAIDLMVDWVPPWILVAAPEGTIERAFAPGDVLPGMVEGDILRLPSSGDLPRVAVNSAGEVAFRANAGAPGFGGPETQGIWGPDGSGSLALKLRQSQQIDAVPGETIASVELLHLADNRTILAQATFGASFTPYYLLIDAAGTIELLADPEAGIDVDGETVALPIWSDVRFAFDADLAHFAIGARTEGIYASVPEPGSYASALAAIAALVATTCRRRSRSCRRVADRLRNARSIGASPRERA